MLQTIVQKVMGDERARVESLEAKLAEARAAEAQAQATIGAAALEAEEGASGAERRLAAAHANHRASLARVSELEAALGVARARLSARIEREKEAEAAARRAAQDAALAALCTAAEEVDRTLDALADALSKARQREREARATNAGRTVNLVLNSAIDHLPELIAWRLRFTVPALRVNLFKPNGGERWAAYFPRMVPAEPRAVPDPEGSAS